MILANGTKFAAKDSAGNVMIKDDLMTGTSRSTWSPQSRLAKDNGFSLNGSFGGVSGGIKFADNSLTCDSEGNCMLKDELKSQGNHALDHTLSEAKKDAEHRRKMMNDMMAKMKDNLGGVSVGFGKAKVGVNWADNSLTCDSEGNCMLKDELAGSNPRTWSPTSRLSAALDEASIKATKNLYRGEDFKYWAGFNYAQLMRQTGDAMDSKTAKNGFFM